MSKYGFDLDGTLDKPHLVTLANDLICAGHEVHIISGCFLDADWQNEEAKQKKLIRLGVDHRAILHVIHALRVGEGRDLVYVLRDLGMRKGALVEELGIIAMFDDSQDYINDMKRNCGASLLKVEQ